MRLDDLCASLPAVVEADRSIVDIVDVEHDSGRAGRVTSSPVFPARQPTAMTTRRRPSRPVLSRCSSNVASTCSTATCRAERP